MTAKTRHEAHEDHEEFRRDNLITFVLFATSFKDPHPSLPQAGEGLHRCPSDRKIPSPILVPALSCVEGGEGEGGGNFIPCGALLPCGCPFCYGIVFATSARMVGSINDSAFKFLVLGTVGINESTA
jgi:hypothetical protein